MSKQKWITQLEENRFLITEHERLAFDESINELSKYRLQEEDITKLLLVLDDGDDSLHYMWGLLHFIEGSISLPSLIRAYVKTFERMYDVAPVWAETLCLRVLNLEETRYLLKQLILQDKSKNTKLLELLYRIANKETGLLSERARFVIDE
jgi:hypothetical protein